MNPLQAHLLRLSLLAVLVFLTDKLTYAQEIKPTAVHVEFFEKEVRPLLVEHCYSCHSSRAEKIQAGLRLDSRGALIEGGDSGAAIVPGDADASLLVEAVRYETYEMPPTGKLADKDIQTLQRWIEIGAPWPEEVLSSSESTSRPTFDLKQREQEHWVWQPIRSPEIPAVVNQAWPSDDIDRFILSRLEKANLHPAADADRSALLRRLYFELIGLPPSPQQAERFLKDTAPDAIARLVDELLDSPHFGERWGRHWLDLVRYAESRGHEFDNDTPNAYQYRDYIIRALNADVPYDQVIREHIAGDLLEKPRLHPTQGFNESILGTGFWFLGEWVHSPVDIRKDEADRFDNMIDVMSKTFLGVTVSCARCHDHKFDAISTADYYSLSGFLQSSDYRQVRFESLEHNRRIAEELAALDTKYRRQISEVLEQAEVSVPTVSPIPSDIAPFVIVDYGTLPEDQYLQDGFIFGNRPRAAGEAYLANWLEVQPPYEEPEIEADLKAPPASKTKRKRRAKSQAVDSRSDVATQSIEFDSSGEVQLRFADASAAVSDPLWNGLESVSEPGMHDKNKLATLPSSGRTLRSPTFTLTNGKVACRVRGSGHVVACVDSHRLVAGPLHGETIMDINLGQAWVELDLARYVGHQLHLEFTPSSDALLEVLFITQGATQDIRAQLDQRQAMMAEAFQSFSESAQRIIRAVAPDLVKTWAAERGQLQRQVMHRSRLALAMMDGTSEDDHVLIRGNSSKPGDVEPRHFLTAISGNQPMPIKSGSGRLELAECINDPANPLTSRVIVNRIWHHLMGRGIVPTTDDFGALGQRPTQPDLLDHLATRFVASGHSIKSMIRTIVLTRTYRMSSQPDTAAIAVDPNNLLWHHRPPKRLEGEAIRDSLLSLSGQIDLTPFGESVPIHLTPFMDGRGRPEKSGPLDGASRRSIYTAVRRNFLSPFMLAFDTPAPFSTMGRRNVSNVPAQALILMNDPFVVEQAAKWGERATTEFESTGSRVIGMYQAAFARQPTEREITVAVNFVDAQCADRNCSMDDRSVWADLAHALINTKEFIFLR